MRILIIAVLASILSNPIAPFGSQDINNEVAHSRDTETCINLRGCGRRDRT